MMSEYGNEYGTTPSLMSSEQFYESVAGSTNSWEETHDIVRADHCRLMQENDKLKLDIGEKERRLEELQGRSKTLEGIRDLMVAAVRCVKEVQTYYANVSRVRVLRKEQDLLQSLQEMHLKNRRIEAEVERLHRQLAIKLKVLYNLKH